jgi:hypothetical protein
VPSSVEVEQTSAAGTPVQLTGQAVDICDPAPSLTNDAPAVFPLGETLVRWYAQDASGNRSWKPTYVRVVDTTPPVISAPALVEAKHGEPVVLSAAASDICDAQPALTSDAPAEFPVGETVVAWTATDASGNVATAQTTVKITDGVSADQTPPQLAVTVDPTELWPADHRMVPIGVTITASDDSGGPVQVQLVSATSNEPDDAGGWSDGRTKGDIEVSADDQIRLRAERNKKGSGRTYTLTWRATDQAGNPTDATAQVTVPLKSSGGGSWWHWWR